MYVSTEHYLVGKVVIDEYRRRIGRVTGAVSTDEGASPSWLMVACKLRTGQAERLVPASEALVRGAGVHISYTKKKVVDSPPLSETSDWDGAVGGLHAYYRLPSGEPAAGSIPRVAAPVALAAVLDRPTGLISAA